MPDDVCGVGAKERQAESELFVEEENRAPVVEATHLIHANPLLC